MSELRVVFAGTPDFAVPTLQALFDSRHEVVAVYTQPDRPAGRGRQTRSSPVKQCALQHGIRVLQPVSLKTEASRQQLHDLRPDIMVVVAFGQILPQPILQTPAYGCLNVHASLLPRWRGAAPIHRALLAGDDKTGVTIMQMDAGLDTGDMLLRKEQAITSDDTSETLHDALAVLGAGALVDVVDAIAAGRPPVAQKQQDALASYAHKLEKAEAEIDWQQAAGDVQRMIRAFNPWPVAYTLFQGKPLRLWRADMTAIQAPAAHPGEVIDCTGGKLLVACGDQRAVNLLEVQAAGKKRMPVTAFLNARKDLVQPGFIFGE